MDTEKQRKHRRNDARLIESGNARSKQLLMVTEKGCQERFGALKARLVFRYEISDLFFLDSQIANLKTSPNFPAIQYSTYALV